jgi:hypothetical protein
MCSYWRASQRYPVYNSLPLIPILSQINPVRTPTPYPIPPRSNLILSNHLRLGLPSGSGFPTDNLLVYAFVFSHTRATCPAYLTFLDLIILITLGSEYKLWSSSLCSFSPPSVTSSLLSTLFSHTLSTCSSLNVRDHFKTHTEPQAKLLPCIF